jgi:hypothetical protein
VQHWGTTRGQPRGGRGPSAAAGGPSNTGGGAAIRGCARRVKGLLGLSPLGLISRLLRDQVSLACKSRNPLYIRRADVSI